MTSVGLVDDALGGAKRTPTVDVVWAGISGRPSKSAGLLNGIASDAS
jgi:hypothetical protein